VELGDLLAEIDDRDLRIAQDLARAQLAEAEAQLAAEDPLVPITEATNQTTLTTTSADVASAEAALAHARRNLAQGAAQLVEGEANDKNIQTERARAERLIKQGAISAAERDLRASAGAASSANVEALRQAHAAAYANVEEQESHLASTRGRLRIVSPVRGVIGKKAVAVGDHVGPGQELLAIAETDAPWITANFRETQLRRMHSGQSVIVHVDAIDQDLRAVVQSIGGATGSRFSVLPPENASGNYVKVVQRIPVRLQLEPSQPGLDRLRAGMSVEPKVRL
jgi:membrane fusion protein (multidrug efflux system)